MAMAGSYDPRFGFDPVAAFLRRPLHEIVGSHASPQSAPPPRVPRTVAGLQTLCARYAWLAVLDLATSLLAEHDAPDDAAHPAFLPHERLQVAGYRALALLQTRQVASAENALAQLGPLTPAAPRHRYETYPALYPRRTGSFVPFELRALALDVRVRAGDAAAIPDAYALTAAVRADSTLAPAERDRREAALLAAIAGYHLAAHQHDAAADAACRLVALCRGTAPACYLYARVLLHVGDFEDAADAVRAASGRQGDSDAMRCLHAGMVLAARGRFAEALLEYDSALEAERKEEPRVSPPNLWVHAGNNAAVCLVHLGRLAEAIDRLEGTLRRDPEIALDEGLAFNLSIMYDLAYPQNSLEKKGVLRKLAVRFGREGFDVNRIPMPEKG